MLRKTPTSKHQPNVADVPPAQRVASSLRHPPWTSRRRIQSFEIERDIIAREEAIGVAGAGKRAAEVAEKLVAEHQRLAGLEERWTTEKQLVDQILELRQQLRTLAAPSDKPDPTPPAVPAPRAIPPGEPDLRCSRTARGTWPSWPSCRTSWPSCKATRPSSSPPPTSRPSPRWWVIGPASGGPHGEERDRNRAQARRHPRSARHRSTPRLGDDRQAHPDLTGRARKPQQAHRRLHAGRPVAASARPKPPWRWPRRSTAASRTSSRST